MARYGATYKQQAVARLLVPERSPIAVVAQDLGVGDETLEQWRAEALAQPKGERNWTAAARRSGAGSQAERSQVSHCALIALFRAVVHVRPDPQSA